MASFDFYVVRHGFDFFDAAESSSSLSAVFCTSHRHKKPLAVDTSRNLPTEPQQNRKALSCM